MGMTYPIQIGNAINYTNTGLTTLTGRDVVALSNGCGIVQADIAAGATGTLLLSGVHKVPAVTTAAFAVGDLLYWDAANSKATKAALNNVPLGMCIDAKAQSGATALVKLGETLPIETPESLSYTNSGASEIAAGAVVALGNCCGIAAAAIAASASGVVYISGTYTVAADTTAAFAVGDLLYWDAANSKATKAALNNVPLGMCIDAKAQSGATALVKLGETLPIETPESLSYTNSGASEIAAGAVVALGNCCGIAAAAIAASASGVVYISGTYTVAADTTEAFALGDLLYWNSAGSKAVKAAAGNVPLGICVEAKASAGATCNVKIGVALALVAAGS